MKFKILFIIAICLFDSLISAKNVKRGENMGKNVLVAYFSATGTTKKVAENLSKAIGADIYEIKPKKAYSNEDLDWTNKNSRSSVEMDKKIKPEIEKKNFNLDLSKYEKIFLGFPIWWYVAPTIINTFLESYDFSNKTIILFATSGGSRFGKTIENLKPSVSETAKIIEGDILNHNPSMDRLKTWAEKYI